jgi:hypothetical protein
MPWPTLTFEVAFTTDPLNTSPSWVDLTSRLYDFQIVRGRLTSLDDFQPGEATFVLENRDRILDPLHASGTYFGNLKPFKRVRLRATYSAVTYDMFDGFVDDDGWAQSYAPPGGSLSTVRCVDGMGLLSNVTLREPFRATIEALSTQPKAWYRWDNADLSVPDSVGNYTGSWFDDIPDGFGAPPLLQSGAALRMSPGTGAGKLGDPFGGVLGQTYSCAVVFAQDGGSGCILSARINVSGAAGFYIGITTAGTLGVSDGQGVGSATIESTALVNDGRPHCVVVTRNGGTAGGFKVWLDGVSLGSGTALSGGWNYGSAPYLNWDLFSSSGNPQGYTVDDIAVWTSVIADADAAAVSLAGTSWKGDTTGTRVGRLLDQAGWPSAWRDVDTGDTYIATANYDEASALAALNECRSTEQGALFITPGGNVRFRQRSKILTDTRHTTVQATFTDKNTALSANEYRYDTPSLRVRNVIARTQVDVSWPGGTERATDTASLGATRTASINTLLTTREDAQSAAGWVLERFKTQRVELESFSVNAAADNATFPAVLGLRLGDRVQVERNPQGVGSAISQQGLIEQIVHRASAGINEWTTTFTVSESSLYETGAAVWGTSVWDTGKWSW